MDIIGQLSENMQAYISNSGRKFDIHTKILGFNNLLDSFFSTTI